MAAGGEKLAAELPRQRACVRAPPAAVLGLREERAAAGAACAALSSSLAGLGALGAVVRALGKAARSTAAERLLLRAVRERLLLSPPPRTAAGADADGRRLVFGAELLLSLMEQLLPAQLWLRQSSGTAGEEVAQMEVAARAGGVSAARWSEWLAERRRGLPALPVLAAGQREPKKGEITTVNIGVAVAAASR